VVALRSTTDPDHELWTRHEDVHQQRVHEHVLGNVPVCVDGLWVDEFRGLGRFRPNIVVDLPDARRGDA
jgi:hypothetical protein